MIIALWLMLMIAAGYGGGMYLEHTSVWSGDTELVRDFSIRSQPLPPPESPQRSESTAQTVGFRELQDHSVMFRYTNGPNDLFHLAETLGGGVAAVDFDLDTQVDLLFVDGGNPVEVDLPGRSNIYCYRNERQHSFEEAAETAGLNWSGYGHGCSVCDFNEDGFPDVLITGFYGCQLYANQGDGTFTKFGDLDTLAGNRWCATAAWSDLDGDGDQDVYITCYTDTPAQRPTQICEVSGRRIHCNPRQSNGVADILLENLGNGYFKDQSAQSGIADFSEYGLGVTMADFDADGRTEIFVANDGDRNLLFHQTAGLKYEECAIPSGLAYNGEGETMGSMGIACADFNSDNRLDLLTTNFINERNVLFSNYGHLSFVDNSRGTATDYSSRSQVGWAAVPLDANLDGLTDLFVANGHVSDIPSQEYQQAPILLEGTPDGLSLASPAGGYFTKKWHGRGACRADLNNDGRSDLVVSHIDTPASLLINDTATEHQFLKIRLIGTRSSRAAESILIKIETADATRTILYGTHGGYLSSHSDWLIAGLGKADSVRRIQVFWPDDRTQELRGVAAGSTIWIVEQLGAYQQTD